MTLQYRIRSKYEDEKWKHRIYLCDHLLLDAIDQWCRSDAEFPIRDIVAGVLYLFSPRCRPFELSKYRLPEQLRAVAKSPEDEYRLTWPRRDESQGAELIAALSTGVTRAVELWGVGRDRPTGAELAEYLVGEIVALQYVVFHHYETTRRDINHWGI
jgi:hypothetical protein